MSLLPREIQEHYLKSQESQRLSSGQGELDALKQSLLVSFRRPQQWCSISGAEPVFTRFGWHNGDTKYTWSIPLNFIVLSGDATHDRPRAVLPCGCAVFLGELEAQTIAHRLGENQREARAKGELAILAFLEGDSRRTATLVAGPTFVEAPKTIRWATRWEGTPVPGSPDRRRQISQNNPTLLRIG